MWFFISQNEKGNKETFHSWIYFLLLPPPASIMAILMKMLTVSM